MTGSTFGDFKQARANFAAKFSTAVADRSLEIRLIVKPFTLAAAMEHATVDRLLRFESNRTVSVAVWFLRACQDSQELKQTAGLPIAADNRSSGR
ncbi:MAG: hypothetical protein F6K28_45845, partial [Microcoleus sp. SIO2G3]|nr:hypothetical protein [Microcoleus sp. SIO2G3]